MLSHNPSNSSTDRAGAFRAAQLRQTLTTHLESRLRKRTGKSGCGSWWCVRPSLPAARFLFPTFSGGSEGAQRTLDEILNRPGLSATNFRNVIQVWRVRISEWPETWRVPVACYAEINP